MDEDNDFIIEIEPDDGEDMDDLLLRIQGAFGRTLEYPYDVDVDDLLDNGYIDPDEVQLTCALLTSYREELLTAPRVHLFRRGVSIADGQVHLLPPAGSGWKNFLSHDLN